jgi:NSS family neurotransmitter:Na+ symporter
MAREKFGSRFGVLMAMVGSAVGLGNMWRFPYMVGEYGGAAFIFVYILCVFFLCLPIFFAEFIIGRRSQANAFRAFEILAPGTPWKWVGLAAVTAPVVILSYYSVIGGWSIQYFFKSCTFGFTERVTQEYLDTMFAGFISSTWAPILGHTFFLIVTSLVILGGVKSGIERFGKVMMPLLYFIVLIIAVWTATLPGASEGLSFLFNPDFSKIDASVCAAALGQAFFSLSLGYGTMLTYASYVSKKEDIAKASTTIAFSDLLFSLIASCAIMPAVFAFGLNTQGGPGLVFQTLPYIFSQMPLGGLVAILFFLSLIVAALTSSISLFEVGVAYLSEEKKMSRKKAVGVLFVLIWPIGVLCSLSFGPLADVKIFGNTIFDFLDKLSANFLMTIGSLLVVLFVGWKMKKPDVLDEFTNGGTINRNAKLFRIVWPIIRYVAPLVILVIFLSNILKLS